MALKTRVRYLASVSMVPWKVSDQRVSGLGVLPFRLFQQKCAG